MRLIPFFLATLFIGCDGPDKDPDELDTDVTAAADADGDGYTNETGDCDDDNAAVYPGADEIWYDGVDQNCDTKDDYDQDEDGAGQSEDCDDTDAAIFPDAEEVCDGIDNDCDGELDETGERTAYVDADGDGFGAGEALGTYCELPVGTADNAEDCDDTNLAVSPSAEEICDGLDNDCDTAVDVGATDGRVHYTDADADGFGDPSTGTSACGEIEGTVEDGTDCNDGDSLTFPGAVEMCDLVDNDCDAEVDEGSPDARTYYLDADADGYGDPAVTASACGAPAGYVEAGTDCDDADAGLSPGAAELCDGIDNDCDAEIDTDSPDALTLYADADLDGYGDPAASVTSCDARDGYVSDGTDCDDTSRASNPGAAEVCDGLDDDCDGAVDEASATDAPTWYIDADVDGFGDSSGGTPACEQPAGFVALDTDCDDGDAAVNPRATEACDGADNDCDGSTDEAGATGEGTWYVDGDGDGYGSSDATMDACDEPSGYAGSDDDCDDADATSNPGAAELDDGVDNDCDLLVDEDFVAEGDVIITEITRQPRFGSSSTNTNGQWFELYNTTDTDIDLSGWYIQRLSSTLAADGFYVDPVEGVTIGAGDYAVFCKTDNFTSSSTVYSFMDPCDYYWGDESATASYAGTYRDNTFNLQRDEDEVALYMGGDASTGTRIDAVHWYYDATNGYWPRDASRSMQLEPAGYDATVNDSLDAWCSTTANSYFDWYLASSTAREFGTPGIVNHACP